MATQVKKPIREAKSRVPKIVVPLLSQICSGVFCGPRYRYRAHASNLEPPIISHPYFWLIYLVFFPVFLARFWKFFTSHKSVFLLVFSLSLGGFLLIKPLVFSPCFLIEFRRFFHLLNTYSFLFSLPLGLKSFFSYQQSHNLKRLHVC